LAPSSFEVHDRLVPAVKNPTRAIVDRFLNANGI
jgi:hypothetical protein